MIVAVTCVKDEAGIIAQTVNHLLLNGVDRILVADGMSTDGTRDILRSFEQVTLFDDQSKGFPQDKIMAGLCDQAAQDGADWVVPFDADEFVYACDGGTIADNLARVPGGVGILYLRMFQHTDWEHRHVEPKRQPKVVTRWKRGAVIAFGNHDVRGIPGDNRWGVLDLREWQYRSFEHLLAKVERTRVMLAAAPDMDPMHGSHMRRLAAMSHGELEVEWKQMCDVPVVFDPIPSPLNCL